MRAVFGVDERPRLDALRERIVGFLALADGEGPLAPEHVSRLHYLDAVVKETARLTPVAPFTSRLLTLPARIGGHNLPAGVAVAPCIYLTHRRPDVGPDPLRFDPDRFVVGARRRTPSSRSAAACDAASAPPLRATR